ncbi:MAG: NifB/NifX family molybdenum-iron cluster-binding protein [Pleomorphochaeta sp.]
MESVKCAFGTDDGIDFTQRHFGDSNRFDMYDISKETVTFIKQIENNSEEERVHADPRKAGSIANILKKEEIQVVVSKQFGPNILRIKKKFVCIKVSADKIEEVKKVIQENFDFIQKVINEKEERGYIVLRDDFSISYVKK